MQKKEILIKIGDSEVLERKASKFGTGSHVVISKKYLGKKAKIIAGKSKLIGKQIKIDFLNSEILERRASKFGTGAHIIVPKEYAKKKIKIIIENDVK